MSALAPPPRTSSTTFGVRLPSVPAVDGGIAAAGGCSELTGTQSLGQGGEGSLQRRCLLGDKWQADVRL